MASGGPPYSGGPYKQREALILLGDIDYKTFVEWCRMAKPPVESLDPAKHPKLKVDKRALWYTRASLERLAIAHGTTLLSDEELQQRLPAKDSDVAERLDQLEQRFEQERQAALQRKDDLLDVVCQEVERQLRQVRMGIHQELNERLQQFEQRLTAEVKGLQLPGDIETVIIGLVAEQFDKSYARMLKDDLPALVRKQIQNQTQSGEGARPAAGTPSRVPARTASDPVPLAPGQRLIVSTLPTNKGKEERPTSFYQITRTSDGRLVAFGEFVELHGISLSTAKHAKDRTENPLPTVKVIWPKGNGYINLALDVGGQAKLHELYSFKQEFRLCELCPHTPDKYPAT
jgi:hypothetical protein